MRLGLGWLLRGSRVRFGLQVLLRRSTELGGTALAAEVDGYTPVVNACRRLRRIDPHPANGIEHFGLLHSSIVDLFARFGLCPFALRVRVNQMNHFVFLLFFIVGQR